MSTPLSPSPQDLNVALLVRESVPDRIRSVQRQIADLEARKTALHNELKRLVDTAVLYGIELCPQGAGPAARAAGPGGTDTPPGLAGTDGGLPASRAA